MSKKEQENLQQDLQQQELAPAEAIGPEGRAELEKQRQEALVRRNKMGNMPVGRLLVSMSVPIIISMLVQALYNIVDSIFVAQLGEEALAAVGFAFPLQNLMIAVAVGTGVGMNSVLGRRLGEKNVTAANRVAVNGLFLAVASWAVFALLGFFGSAWYVSAFADNSITGGVAQMAESYLSIVCIGSLGLFLAVTTERLLQATGRTVFSMVSQMVGAVLNIILDPIMIFGWFGFPAMGVAGAALATVIGQFGSMILAIAYNKLKNHELNLSLKGFRPNWTAIKHIYRVGVPSIIMQSLGSVMLFCMNLIMVPFGTTAVSVLSVYFRLQSFIFMPVFGLNSGMIPIIAFNYGAQNRLRIEKTIQRCVVVAVAIMLFGTALFWIFPGFLLGLFDAGPAMLELGTHALRRTSIAFPFVGVSIVFSGVFQALGRGAYSLIVSLIRQLGIMIPAAWLLAQLGGAELIWFSGPIAEISCMFIAIAFFRMAYKKIIKPLPLGAP
ncbi:MAG: MATE family efflux transporter [Ruminococcaceae bacterium]|nr:MATE family efflux transporter [Oscillospiraceae bacterium]